MTRRQSSLPCHTRLIAVVFKDCAVFYGSAIFVPANSKFVIRMAEVLSGNESGDIEIFTDRWFVKSNWCFFRKNEKFEPKGVRCSKYYIWTVLIARIVRSAKKIRSIPIVRLRLKIHLFSSGHHDYRPLLELLIFRVKSKGSKCPGFGRKPPSVPVVRTMLTRNFNCHRCYANWNG